MKTMAWSEFRRMSARQVKKSRCVEVTIEGEHLFYALVGAEGGMRAQLTSRAALIDAAKGDEDATGGGTADEQSE